MTGERSVHDRMELASEAKHYRRSPFKTLLTSGRGVVELKDEFVNEGFVDILKIRPVARMGYRDYAVVDAVFSMLPPDTKTGEAPKKTGF